MNTLKKYKGYVCTIEFDTEDRILVGRVIGIRDGINFHGTSIDELEAAFHESIDDYLEICKKLEQQPNKPYSGRLMLRIPTCRCGCSCSQQWQKHQPVGNIGSG